MSSCDSSFLKNPIALNLFFWNSSASPENPRKYWHISNSHRTWNLPHQDQTVPVRGASSSGQVIDSRTPPVTLHIQYAHDDQEEHSPRKSTDKKIIHGAWSTSSSSKNRRNGSRTHHNFQSSPSSQTPVSLETHINGPVRDADALSPDSLRSFTYRRRNSTRRGFIWFFPIDGPSVLWSGRRFRARRSYLSSVNDALCAVISWWVRALAFELRMRVYAIDAFLMGVS